MCWFKLFHPTEWRKLSAGCKESGRTRPLKQCNLLVFVQSLSKHALCFLHSICAVRVLNTPWQVREWKGVSRLHQPPGKHSFSQVTPLPDCQRNLEKRQIPFLYKYPSDIYTIELDLASRLLFFFFFWDLHSGHSRFWQAARLNLHLRWRYLVMQRLLLTVALLLWHFLHSHVWYVTIRKPKSLFGRSERVVS